MTERVVFALRDVPGISGLSTWLAHGGYEGLRQALARTPAEVLEEVKKSGLRGRGGAGFPTGAKWSFVPGNLGKPKYLCCNGDESEPGTFKDREILENLPHQVVEGIAICCYAVGIERAFLYLRGEMREAAETLRAAVAEARAAGFLGRDILGSGFNLEVEVNRGAGAYICGEESALLNSLEGYRGLPRSKPPFPAVSGLYACPTVINNVETLATLPAILRRGGEWYSRLGTEKSKGTRVFCLSGHVRKPGNYELELGTPFRTLIYEHGGGILGDRRLKAFVPGGSSAPLLVEKHLDVPMDYESVEAAGSMAGSGAVVVMHEDTCIVGATLRMVDFYREESCGKCTPCREGTGWLVDLLHRIEHGQGRPEDLALLEDVSDNLLGKAFCPLGDSATSPILSSMKYFREEYEHHVREGRCLVGPRSCTSLGSPGGGSGSKGSVAP